MEVSVIHYHLNPGGVTRIIEAQLKGIKGAPEPVSIAVLCGNGSIINGPAGVKIIPAGVLQYMDANMAEKQLRKSVEEIRSLVSASFTGKHILHFHNPNLGKNPALTMAVFELASEGYPVINHCHDFAEDRPANLAFLQKAISQLTQISLQQVMYPDFPWYHFIVLNSCDYDRILAQGIPAPRVHLLPNPVSVIRQEGQTDYLDLRKKLCHTLGIDYTKKICTYPVRAIERKNLGEFILLAALFADAIQFTVTLPPKNPVELPGYYRWKAFCTENKLSVKFEAGEVVNHEELINISDFCITTSVREGFGMVYLEPWLAGTPVVGRELACIVDDLIKQGVEFPRLYSSFLVETADDTVDFKDLRKDDQEQIIKNVINQQHYKLRLYKNNPFLNLLFTEFPEEVILRNRKVIREKFSIEEYGKKLFAIYKAVSR